MENEFIEIRGIHSQDKEVYPYFLESRERLVKELDGMDALKKNTNVYIGVCPRSRKEGTKDAVSRAHVLWLDLDVKKAQGNEKQGVLKRLEDFMFPPTVIVDSGNGYHAYWALKEPESDKKLIEQYLRSLADALGADKNCCEVARVLRLPGTLNRKVEHAPLDVCVVRMDSSLTYNLSDFDVVLQPANEENATKRKSNNWMADTLNSISEGNRNASFTSIAGRLHHDGVPPSAIVALLAPYAEKHQFPDAELRTMVEGLCRRYPPKTSFPVSPYSSEMTETESKVMEAIPLAKFMEGESQNIEWLVDRILPKEGVGILAAPAGYGKSWMLLDLAIEYSRGGKWLDHFQTQAGRILYLDEESSPNLLRRRLRKLLAAKTIQEPVLDIHFAVGQGLRLSDKKSVSRLRVLLASLRPSLVIIDSLIRVHGAEENSATEMAQSFAVVKGWVREFGCSFLFADHQKKPGTFGTIPDLLEPLQLLPGAYNTRHFIVPHNRHVFP